MNKAKKSLLFSLLSLVFALAITATSTYAWFVVNRTVEATNMQVTVKSDTTWLVIGANASKPASVAAIGTDGTQRTAQAAAAANVEVLPIMYDEADNTEGIKWKYSTGAGYDSGTATGGYTALNATQVSSGEYFVKYTFYVGLTATSAATQYHLRVNSLTVTANASGDAATFLPAVSAMIECPDTNGAKVDYEDINGKSGTYYSDKADLLATVAVDTVYTINVYVYINGDNAVVKSSNATTAKLGGFTVTATFGVSNAQ